MAAVEIVLVTRANLGCALNALNSLHTRTRGKRAPKNLISCEEYHLWPKNGKTVVDVDVDVDVNDRFPIFLGH